MKKATLQFIATYLSENTQYADDNEKSALESALTEINTELNKGKAQKEANQAVYVRIHDAVIKALTSAENPVTAQELADETGYPKGKIVYGLSHYWGEEIEKIEGKVNTYTLKS
jgi:DNA-binding transcriptional regulator GbsR (MarR family)